MYVFALCTINIRIIYSIVNTMVIIHSKTNKISPYFKLISFTLSNETANMLKRIKISKTTSKTLPNLVSASNIISYKLP